MGEAETVGREETTAAVLRHVEAGEWELAMAGAEKVAAGAGPLPVQLAWPAAMVLYLHGDLAAASGVLCRADATTDPADGALLAAWGAAVEWARGDVTACTRDAARALTLAQASGRPQALAAAHTVLALLAAAEGDRRANDRHYALALAAAIEARDPTQQLRIRANRASQRMEEGDLTGALGELDRALESAADGSGAHPAALGMVQHNRAELLLRSGRLAAARDGYRAACTALQHAGSNWVAYPLTGLGETHELRGDLPQARAAFEEAVLVSQETGIAQAVVPALSGLARVQAASGDPAAARTAGEAIAAATALTEPLAQLAAGWAALTTDPAAARGYAQRATALARTGRDTAALAEALELSAMTCPPAEADALLADALRVWRDIGVPVAVARVELARARLGGPASAAQRALAEHRLRALGAGLSGTRSLSRTAEPWDQAVSVRMLGSFAVLHGGTPVPPAAWQSRKARDVLKLVVARRGRPITREALGEALWPGQPNVANRLSIALSVLRTVLDPERTAPPGRYVRTSEAGIAYDPQALVVDVDIFLRLAGAGLAAAGAGRPDEARVLLPAAATAYTGDVLDDEPDLDAVAPLRDEARTAHRAVLRTLGGVYADAGDLDAAVQVWLRLLDHDPYDEDGALRLIHALVASGRHGEAARYHRRYAERMKELGLPAAPLQRPTATVQR